MSEDNLKLYKKYNEEFGIKICLDTDGIFYISNIGFEIREGIFLTSPCIRNENLDNLINEFKNIVDKAKFEGNLVINY